MPFLFGGGLGFLFHRYLDLVHAQGFPSCCGQALDFSPSPFDVEAVAGGEEQPESARFKRGPGFAYHRPERSREGVEEGLPSFPACCGFFRGSSGGGRAGRGGG